MTLWIRKASTDVDWSDPKLKDIFSGSNPSATNENATSPPIGIIVGASVGGFVFLAVMSYLAYWIARHRRKSNGLGIESSSGKTWKMPWRLPHIRIEIRGDPRSPSELDPEMEQREIDSDPDPGRQLSELEGSSVQQDDSKENISQDSDRKHGTGPRNSMDSTSVSDSSTQTYKDVTSRKEPSIGDTGLSSDIDSSQGRSCSEDFDSSTYVDSSKDARSSIVGDCRDSDSGSASDSDDELGKGIHSGKC